MKLAIVLGTRPEIIKLSSLIRECQKRNLDYFIIHSNQHYSPEMDNIFFKELELPKPKYNLGVVDIIIFSGGNFGKSRSKVSRIIDLPLTIEWSCFGDFCLESGQSLVP